MDDTIYRQAAIDEMEKSKERYFDRRVIIGKMQDIVNNLPSAQPDVPETNVEDTISRQAAIEAIKELCEFYTPTKSVKHPHMDFVIEELQRLPSAQPERKKGKWIVRIRDNRAYFICSECNDEVDICGYGFCPTCGADMRGEEDEMC